MQQIPENDQQAGQTITELVKPRNPDAAYAGESSAVESLCFINGGQGILPVNCFINNGVGPNDLLF